MDIKRKCEQWDELRERIGEPWTTIIAAIATLLYLGLFVGGIVLFVLAVKLIISA